MRAVLLYLVLVGLPVLGILGLLRVGQTLSAPTSLAGSWNAQLNVPGPPGSSAGDPLVHPGPTVLSITQSGPRVFLTFDDIQKTTLIGSVQGLLIYASFIPERATDASGAVTTAVHFRGRVDRQTEPDQLLGALIFNRGQMRTEVPLIAIRNREIRKGVGSQ